MIRETTVEGVRDAVRRARVAGRRVGFVPTMGALHAGHLSLVQAARAAADCVVMSVFVNPTQFGPSEDFSRYPRDLERDAALAADAGVDLLFAPSVDAMYPGGTGVRVEADDATTRWEGEVRPGHFAGVLTVVTKLFNIVGPDVAVFGRKDFQQAALIQRMVRQLHEPVRIVVAPTVREPDGLALSSRNVYLSPAERERALCLVSSLRTTVAAFAAGERDGAALARIGRDQIDRAGDVAIDYFAVVDPERMLPVARVSAADVAIVAARVGRTRLIDNAILGEGP